MVHNLDRRLVTTVNNSDGGMLHVGLSLQASKLATNKSLCGEDSVLRVHRGLVLCGTGDEMLVPGECDMEGVVW